MKQSDISIPKVVSGPSLSLLTRLKLHTLASILRTCVWCISGDGSQFDRVIYVGTPGLGTGQVRRAVCLPKDPHRRVGSLPLLLCFEGGGFILGQPEDGQEHCRRLADELDAIVISVDYAKAPRHPYPQALLQLYQVLKWALSPAARLQGIVADPSKVALLGNSAGGNLVASLSLLLAFTTGPTAKLRQDLPAEFQQVLQVMLYPSLDTGLPYKTRFERASDEVQARSLPVSIAQLMEDCYLPPHIDRNCLFVRPTLAGDELLASLRLPPSLVLTAGMDCLKAEADLYAENLGRAGVKVILQEYPQAIHGFSHYTKGADFRPDDVGDCWERVCEGLREAYS